MIFQVEEMYLWILRKEITNYQLVSKSFKLGPLPIYFEPNIPAFHFRYMIQDVETVEGTPRASAHLIKF